jgi:hypothetical protein
MGVLSWFDLSEQSSPSPLESLENDLARVVVLEAVLREQLALVERQDIVNVEFPCLKEKSMI